MTASREDLRAPLQDSEPSPGTAATNGHSNEAPTQCDAAHSVASRQHAHGDHRTPLWTLKATQLLGTAAYACLGKFLPVFYARIKVSRTAIGALQLVGPGVAFVSNIFWAAIIDRSKDYKSILVSTAIVGSAITFLQLTKMVQDSLLLLFGVTIVSGFFLCTGGPIVDALCITVLAEHPESGEVYGDQRLWCAIGWGGMSLLMGPLIDLYGMAVGFIGYAVFSVINLSILVIWFPSPKRRTDPPAGQSGTSGEQCTTSQESSDHGTSDVVHTQDSAATRPFCNAEVIWFFMNLFLYGIAFALVENLLLVFLQQEFEGTTNLLLGASVAVMCLFEVPVFKYVDRLWTRAGVGLTGVIGICQLILAVRCVLYIIIPEDKPWIVLLIEPLHGITFAGMWAATVEYGTRLAGPDAVARMQSLVNGIFYMLALAVGSCMWGVIAEPPAKGGIGFRKAFAVDAAFILCWSFVWQTGMVLIRRKRSRRGSSGAAREVVADSCSHH